MQAALIINNKSGGRCPSLLPGAASAFISEPKPDSSSSAKVIVLVPSLKLKTSVIGVMRLNGSLNACLQQVNEQADEMCYRLVKQMAKDEGVTEELKRRDLRCPSLCDS